MRKTIILLIALLLSIPIFAQLEVKEGSFKEVPGFVNINIDKMYDDNDKPYAVLKIKTENISGKQRRELNFGGDAQTFFEAEYRDGEVWLYISYYATFIKISHEELSSTEYYFPFDMKPKCGYELTLVNKTATENVGTGSLTIITKPESDAIVKLNGIVVSRQTPYINDLLNAGSYEITVSKEKYKTETRNIVLENGAKEVVEIELVYDMANITIKVDNDAEVYIDGYMRRKGTWVGDLSSGTHEIECRKLYHNPAKRTINVVVGRKMIYALEPTPIYGNLEINTEPNGATVFIDNKNYGQTPLALNNIIIGTHELVIEKSGYSTLEKTIVLEQSSKLSVNEKLPLGISNRTFTVDGVSFEMVAVEGGTFLMGAQKTNFKGANYDEEAQDNESPVHQVTLSDYYIGKFEVTQDIWTVVMEANPKNMNGDKYPLYGINWYDALSFCNKLSEKIGRTPYYKIEKKTLRGGKGKQGVIVNEIIIDTTANGFRLPTEAEWEYAARGGNKSMGYKYSGSNDVDVVVSYRKEIDYSWCKLTNSDYKIVGSKKPNELGIYDMSGNVYEWCYDIYGDYPKENQINPVGVDCGDLRVARGGGYISDVNAYEIRKRNYAAPNDDEVHVKKYVYNYDAEGKYYYYYKTFGEKTGFRLVLNH